MAQYTKLKQQAADMDTTELGRVKGYETIQQLQAVYGKKFDSKTLAQSRMDVAGMLDVTVELISIRQKLQQLQGQQDRQSHEKERSQER